MPKAVVRTARLAQVPDGNVEDDGRTHRTKGRRPLDGRRYFAQDADDLARAGGKTPGGIDISSAHLKMNTAPGSAGKFQMKVDPALIEEYRFAPGFVPQIQQVLPITNLPALIGIK